MDYLPLNDCLLLRQANKDLKRIVDSTFQRPSTHPQEKFEAELGIELNRDFSKRNSLRKGQGLRAFTEVELLSRDTSTWLVPQGNPWLIGHVVLDLRLLQESNRFRLLISRFGIHISSLTVLVHCRNEDNPERMVNLLLELLSTANFPNLQQLRLKGFVKNECVQILSEGVEAFSEFPKLEALNLIDLNVNLGRGDDYGHLALPFLEKYGPQLKVLHCQSSLVQSRNLSLDLLNNLLPSVCSLEVGLGLGSNGIAKLSLVGWKIKHLAVHVESVKILKVLNNFSPTLAHLRLNCRYLLDDLDLEEMRPLMELKQLTVSYFKRSIGSLSNFIGRCCPNLEKFCWDGGYMEMTDVEAKDFAEKLKLLFGLVPKLRKTVFRWYNGEKRKLLCITLRRDECV